MRRVRYLAPPFHQNFFWLGVVGFWKLIWTILLGHLLTTAIKFGDGWLRRVLQKSLSWLAKKKKVYLQIALAYGAGPGARDGASE
jgi:hypothetical protein